MLRESLEMGEKRKLKIAPLIGVGVPGTVLEDGGLEGGVLNLPGDWKSPDFHLPARIRTMIHEIGGEQTQVIMHNDAVVQGLSEAPFMSDVEHWARADHRHRTRQRAVQRQGGKAQMTGLQFGGRHFIALATDYDGTLAEDGAVSDTTLAALKQLQGAQAAR